MGFTRPAQKDPAARLEALGPGSLPGKSPERARNDNRELTGSFATGPAAEAETTIRRWLDSLAEHPENLAAPPLEACALISPRAAEKFLRDPDYGYAPLLPIERYAYLTKWKDMLPFQEALLARWGELDLESALLKLPPPNDQDEAKKIAAVLYDRIDQIGSATAAKLLEQWTEKGAENPSPAYGSGVEKVMQAWASGDPKGAWQWLVNGDPDQAAWQNASRGYLLGLYQPDWEALLAKVDELPSNGAETQTPHVLFRREVISVWGLEDPLAALGALDAEPKIEGGDHRVGESAQLIAEWLTKQPSNGTWLRDWEPQGINRDEVFARIANDFKNSAEVRTMARGLIHDLDLYVPAEPAMDEATRAKLLEPMQTEMQAVEITE